MPEVTLHQLIESAGHSQRSLAAAVGVSPAAINQICKGIQPKSAAQKNKLINGLIAELTAKGAEADQLKQILKIQSNSPEETPMILMNPAIFKHFKMARNPFPASNIDGEADVLLTSEYLDAVKLIKDAAHNHQFIIFVGPQGAGKTTVIDGAAQEMSNDESYRFVRVLDPDAEKMKIATVVKAISEGVGVQYRGFDRHKSLTLVHDTLAKPSEPNTIVVIDDCHNMTPQTLKAIKRIWDNLKQGHRHLLGIVLVAQDGIYDRLIRDELREVSTQAEVYELWGLRNPNELSEYIHKKLKKVNREGLFQIEAIKLFWDKEMNRNSARQWIAPRYVNDKCQEAMNTAYLAKEDVITPEIIERLYSHS